MSVKSMDYDQPRPWDLVDTATTITDRNKCKSLAAPISNYLRVSKSLD